MGNVNDGFFKLTEMFIMYFFLFVQEAEEGWSGDQEACLRPLQVMPSVVRIIIAIHLHAAYLAASVTDSILIATELATS